MSVGSRLAKFGLTSVAVWTVVLGFGDTTAFAVYLSESPSASFTGQNYVTSSKYLDAAAALGASDYSSGKCVDSMFDWATGPHHDGRVVRTCTSTTLGTTNWTNGSITFSGVGRAGGCIVTGVNTTTGTGGTRSGCEMAVGAGTVANCGSSSAECWVRLLGSIKHYVSSPTAP